MPLGMAKCAVDGGFAYTLGQGVGMSPRIPSYLIKGRQVGPFLFRTTIPQHLRPKFGQAREVRLSLRTGIESEARKLAVFLQVYAEEIYRRALFYEGTLGAEGLRLFLKHRLAELGRASCFTCRSIPLLVTQEQWGYTQAKLQPMFQPVSPSWMNQDTAHLQIFASSELFGVGEGQGFAIQLLSLVLPRLEAEEMVDLLEANDLLPLIGVRTRKQAMEVAGLHEAFLKVAREQELVEPLAEAYAREIAEGFFKKGNPEEVLELLQHLPKDRLKQLQDEGVTAAHFVAALEEATGDVVKLALKVGVDYLPERARPKSKQTRPQADDALAAFKALRPDQPLTGELELTESQADENPRISVLFEEYEKAHPKMKDGMGNVRVNVRLFIQAFGDKRVGEIKKAHARQFKELLQLLPARYTQMADYKDLPLEALKADKTLPKMAPLTVGKRLGALVTLFNWASDKYDDLSNPFSGAADSKKGRKKLKRLSFTDDELARIFEPQDYLEQSSELVFRYWVPLLALYHGARINEICQLHLDDVRQEQGIWVMSFVASEEDDAEYGIQDDEELLEMTNSKSTKNESSERTIPIHPALLKLGLDRFVDRQKRNKGQVRLFNQLTQDSKGHWSRKVSRWFNGDILTKKLQIKTGPNAKLKVFHSFRNTFITRLKNAGVPREQIAEVVGHAHQDMTFGTYAGEFRPEFLRDNVMAKLSFPSEAVNLGKLSRKIMRK